MKNYISFLFLIGALAPSSFATEHFLSDDFINSINEKQTSWKAGRNHHPDTPAKHLRQRNGRRLDPNHHKRQRIIREIRASRAIPESFDGRIHWYCCESLLTIMDQGICGSCWAFASAGVMTDRLCIQSKGKVKFEFSPENLLACCPDCGDCSLGGLYTKAFEYWVDEGLVSGGDFASGEGCQPYEYLAYDGYTPACTTNCTNENYTRSYAQDKRFGRNHYTIRGNVRQIQTEILKKGPVVAPLDVYTDFYHYRSGVYVHTTGYYDGGHVVKIIGWGTENGIPYWLVANSWGHKWGDLGGFFKILRGDNHCGIESEIYAGNPVLS